jgi:HEAT repeat protein
MPLFGPPNVDKLKGKKDIEGLIDVLIHQKDARLRDVAARALGELADARSVEPLFAALLDADTSVRESATLALARVGAPAAPKLVAALRNPRSSLRTVSAKLLGSIGGEAPLQALIEATDDPDWHVREAAMESLGSFKDARAIQTLLVGLKDLDWNVCAAAARALGKLKETSAVMRLVETLKYPRQEVRQAVREALAKMGESAIEPLFPAFKDWDLDVRQAAADILYAITGKDFGLDLDAWRDWWEARKKTLSR